MACPNKYQKSSLMAYNSTEQTTGNNIKFTNISYQSGVSINLTEGSDTIYLKSPGLYYVDIDIIMSNTTATTASIVQMYINGVALAGGLTEASITATGDFVPGSISALVPVGTQCQCACNKGVPVTFVISGTTATVEGVNIVVMKIA